MRVAVDHVATPHRFQMLWIERGRFDVALGRQLWPFFIPAFAASGAIQVTVSIGIDLDFAAIALDDDSGIAQQTAGIAMHGLIAGVEKCFADRSERPTD